MDIMAVGAKKFLALNSILQKLSLTLMEFGKQRKDFKALEATQ
jgi:hypothetical protein